MRLFTFTYLNNYKNHGQNAEQSIRYVLTGEIQKADNIRYDLGSDCLNYQIKSARATICKGTDLKAYLELDSSSEYIYATKDGKAYIMSKTEYIEFCSRYSTVTTESDRHGKGVKLRLKHESREMLSWLEGNL